MHPSFAAAPACFPAPPELSKQVAAVLAECIDIRALWWLDHDPAEAKTACAPYALLVFADAATLHRLHRYPRPRDDGISLFVVTDGDYFEAAWGSGISGSLARWSWRQISPGEAFYDQARWSASGGGVVRLRRKALLLWEAPGDERRGWRERRV